MVLKIHVRVGCKRPSRRLKKTPLQSFNKSLAMYVVILVSDGSRCDFCLFCRV